MTAHVRVLAFTSSLFLVGQSAAPPRFEAIQADLLSTGGTFVNAAADYDNDGDADLFVGFNGAANRLYRNDRGVLVDASAAAGVADAAHLVDSGSGYDSQNDLPVHVGLGTADAFDVEVTYPAAGERKLSRVGNVKPRGLLTVPFK